MTIVSFFSFTTLCEMLMWYVSFLYHAYGFVQFHMAKQSSCFQRDRKIWCDTTLVSSCLTRLTTALSISQQLHHAIMQTVLCTKLSHLFVFFSLYTRKSKNQYCMTIDNGFKTLSRVLQSTVLAIHSTCLAQQHYASYNQYY